MNIIYSLLVLLVFDYPSCNQLPELPQSSKLPDSLSGQKREMTATMNLVFKSADNGETWRDISNGLPEPLNDSNSDGIRAFFADDNGLWLTGVNGFYYSRPDYTAPYWSKANIPYEPISISPGRNGIYAYHYLGGIFQKTIGTSEWSPVFPDFREKRVRGIVETDGGDIFINTDMGLFKSTDQGKTWKTLPVGGVGSKLVESEGILVTTCPKGIIRSTDGGDNWHWVIKEGGVGVDVAKIKGGFAAITYSAETKTRRVRASYDGGKTWQAIDAGLPADLSISSIIEVGDYLFCGHPDGIFRSADKGKTWKLLLPSVKGKVYHLSVSGKVIYAIPRIVGC